MRTAIAVVGLAALASVTCAQEQLPPPLVFHASFDGTVEAVARGNGTPVRVEGPVEYRPGRIGQALLAGDGGALVFYETAGNLRRSGGTVEMWVCPLDWTGAEDTFHSFFEAKDPGWLVLYRYYQGGILTLMGTDGANYRAAAGPRIRWTPGEWHHLAGTWRASGLAVYVDGERVGFAPNPPMPDDWPEVFRVGDHPWHVERQQQTLIDEVKLYAAPLSDEEIARAYRGEPVDWRPTVAVELRSDAEQGTLAVLADAAGIVGEMGAGRSAEVALTAEGGGPVLASATITRFPDDRGRAVLPVGDLAEGNYDVRVRVLDEAGTEVAATVARFVMPGPAVWSGNELGIADEVLKPWTPLTADADTGLLRCWGREYRFGTLLDTVRSQDQALLAEPVRIEAVVDGEAVPLTGPACSVQSASPTRAELAGSAAGAGLRATLRHEMEYDGFTWTDVEIAPEGGERTVDELRLTWALPAEQATLMHADAQRWINNRAGALPAEGWTSDWLHFFWLGNEIGGLSWYCESDQYWVAAEDTPTIEARRDGDVVRVTVRLIAAPTTLAEPVRYGFGMMATPVRPYPDDYRALRMAPAPRPTFEILWPNAWFKYYGYTEPQDPEKLTEHVRQAHGAGTRIIPYINLNYMSAGAPEWQYYGPRWHDGVRAVTPSDVAAMGYPSMGTCPAVRDWQDFILYRINEMIDRYEVDGIYIDCWNPYPCTVGGCGWTDAAGKVHPTRPIRAYREILRRVQTLFQHKRPEPLIMVHMSSQVVIPMLSFTDTILDGEQFRSGHLEDDYLELLPPDMFRAEFLGRNWGPVEFFLPELRDPYLQRGTANLIAYLLAHDVQPWPIWSDAEQWTTLYDALDAVGWEQSQFFPYWQAPAAQVPEGMLASAYAADGAAVLALMNTGEATEAQVTVDVERLGLPGIARATDVLTGEALAVEGATITVPLDRRQGRTVILTGAE